LRPRAARAKFFKPAQSAKLDEQLPDGSKRLSFDDCLAIELYFGSAHRNGQGEASPGVRITNTPDEPSLPPGYRWFKFRHQVPRLAGRNGAFAGLVLAFVESILGSYLIQSKIAGDKEDPMSAYASSAKPYKGLGMEGAVAKWYASLTKKSLEDFKTLARRIAAQISPGSKVLEVAPGPGYCAIELAKLGNYEIVGLDISKTFIEIASANAARAGVRVDFRRGNVSDMPFGDETFDFVLCRAAFKNFSEPKRALQEMYRVLKPGGQALIIDLRRDASKESITQAVNDMNLGAVNRGITKLTFRFMLLKRAYTKREFEELIAEAKFNGIEIREDLTGLEIWLTKNRANS
jgi:ubiquinone/menaquinone biosynthesis C-methylase UbiE